MARGLHGTDLVPSGQLLGVLQGPGLGKGTHTSPWACGRQEAAECYLCRKSGSTEGAQGSSHLKTAQRASFEADAPKMENETHKSYMWESGLSSHP